MTQVNPGDVLAGKYRVTRVLGVGGMGVVVAATHMQLDEPVALKFMLPEALGSTEAVARFLREARAAVKLRSEHVARVSDVGTLETGAPYIVMEYLEGTDLAGLLATQGPLLPEAAVEFVLHACDAVAEAHAMGVVHRDLKPANLFLTHRKDGTPLVKVLDFGISKSSALNEQNAGALTKTGGIMGSPLYMSPEQMKSAKDTDARTDIWALGVILYELLGGRPPFDSDTIGGLMALVLTELPPPLILVRPNLPRGLCDVVGKCLEKDRNLRWSSTAQLAAALGPYAPVRARPIVDRISIVMGQAAPSRLASSPALAASAGTEGATRTGTGWGGTANNPAGPSFTPSAGIVAAGVLALGLLTGGVWFGVRMVNGQPTAASSSAAASTTQATAAVPAGQPSAPPPPTAGPVVAAPPATASAVAAPAPAAPTTSPRPVTQASKSSPPSPSPPPGRRTTAAPTHAPGSPPPPTKPADGLFDTSN